MNECFHLIQLLIFKKEAWIIYDPVMLSKKKINLVNNSGRVCVCCKFHFWHFFKKNFHSIRSIDSCHSSEWDKIQRGRIQCSNFLFFLFSGNGYHNYSTITILNLTLLKWKTCKWNHFLVVAPVHCFRLNLFIHLFSEKKPVSSQLIYFNIWHVKWQFNQKK